MRDRSASIRPAAEWASRPLKPGQRAQKEARPTWPCYERGYLARALARFILTMANLPFQGERGNSRLRERDPSAASAAKRKALRANCHTTYPSINLHNCNMIPM
jgi:hypothetical protein